MYQALEKKLMRLLAETQFELSRCSDVYRINTIIANLMLKALPLGEEAVDMIKEIEDNGA